MLYYMASIPHLAIPSAGGAKQNFCVEAKKLDFDRKWELRFGSRDFPDYSAGIFSRLYNNCSAEIQRNTD